MIDLKSLCADMNDDHSAIMEKSGEIIPEIYRILESPSQKTREMTEEQNRIFRYLYGSPRADRSGNNKLDINKILNRYGIIPDEGKEAEQVQLLFYAVQTYFSILIKLVVRDDLLPESDCSDEELILGEFAKKAGIKNFCDKDQYTWPVYELENGFAKILAGIKELLSAYRSGESTDNLPEDDNADHIRHMYEALIPKELRHALEAISSVHFQRLQQGILRGGRNSQTDRGRQQQIIVLLIPLFFPQPDASGKLQNLFF